MPTVDIDEESTPPLTQAQQDANELAYARQLTCKHNFNPAAGGTTMTIETNAGQKIGTGNHFREMGDGTMVGDLRV
ncbi:MAG TPA: hypothetical protein PLK94_07000, partial [Alphaproteobacteria bacterium]|nr:hypothetical protein [Alphaproteobacteria bacterium]